MFRFSILKACQKDNQNNDKLLFRSYKNDEMDFIRKSQCNRGFIRAVKKVIDKISKTEPNHKILNLIKGELKILSSGTSDMTLQYLKINYFIITSMQKIISNTQFILEIKTIL